jgi:hypothetical protein
VARTERKIFPNAIARLSGKNKKSLGETVFQNSPNKYISRSAKNKISSAVKLLSSVQEAQGPEKAKQVEFLPTWLICEWGR